LLATLWAREPRRRNTELDSDRGHTARMSIPQTDEADLITPTRSTRRPSRRPWWIAAVIVVVVGGAVIIGLVATGHDTGIPFVPKPPTRSAFTFTMGDVSATSLGGHHSKPIETLKVSSSSLQVNVLTDTANKPVAAVAKVTFVADATTKDGQHIQITRNAQYLLDQADGTWLVSGYPLNTTSVDVVQPSAGPSGASGSGSGGSS
jgi:hypothetical protein